MLIAADWKFLQELDLLITYIQSLTGGHAHETVEQGSQAIVVIRRQAGMHEDHNTGNQGQQPPNLKRSIKDR